MGYGLSRELALKTAGKYSDSDEVQKRSKFLILIHHLGWNYCLVPGAGHLERAWKSRNGRLPRVAQVGSRPLCLDERTHTGCHQESQQYRKSQNGGEKKNVKLKLKTLTITFQALRMNKEYENISFFLSACTDYGIDKNYLFQVQTRHKEWELGRFTQWNNGNPEKAGLT